MKIKRVIIESFGQLRNWNSGELSQGMNIIYGPNESGKSTITEFIRTTFFMPKRSTGYPRLKKTDAGTIEVVMDNGDTRTYQRENKEVVERNKKKIVSEEFPGMDIDTYRSMYGLDLDLLNESKAIESSKMKSGYMSIPGGEKIPEVSKYLDDEIENYITPNKMTTTKIIGRCIQDIEDSEDSILQLEKNIDQYNELVKEKKELEFRVSSINKTLDVKNSKKRVRDLQKAQKSNIEKYLVLKGKVDGLDKYKDFNLQDKENYDQIKSEIAVIQKELPVEGMKEKDLNAILTKDSEINNAWQNLPNYLQKKADIESIKKSIDKCDSDIADLEKDTGWTLKDAKKVNTEDYVVNKAESVARNRRRASPDSKNKKISGLVVGAIGLILLLVGLFTNIAITIVGIVIFLIGVFLFIRYRNAGSVNPNEFLLEWNAWIKNEGYPANSSPEEIVVLVTKLKRMIQYEKDKDNFQHSYDEAKASISLYENTVNPLVVSLKIEGKDVADCVTKLHVTLDNAKIEQQNELSIKRRIENLNEKKSQLSKIVRKYGSEEEFLNIAKNKREYDGYNSEMNTLKESIESTVHMTVEDLINVLNSPEEVDEEDVEEDTESMNRKIGELSKTISNIMDDGEYDKLQSIKTMNIDMLRQALKEWATLSMAQNLIRNSSSRFYSDLQPEVIKTADHYLSLMTENMYRMDTDPTNIELTVVDVNGKKKSLGEWSSGLTDQIYLSIKMALAKEINDEKMPLLLDDILVRFDIDRKQGACKAIYECSKGTQIIMFTCDKTILNFFKLEGEYTEIMM